MKLILQRIAKNNEYTIGKFYINGEFICNTMEDADRGLKKTDNINKIQNIKIYAKTAIPTGIYKIGNRYSPKFSNSKGIINIFGKERNLYQVLNVPGWEYVLFHSGNKPEDTEGCILFGKNNVKGQVTNSVYWTYEIVYKRLDAVYGKEEITLEII